MGVLEEPFNIGIVQVGKAASSQGAAISEFSSFMGANFPVNISSTSHAYIEPMTENGKKWVRAADGANGDLGRSAPDNKQIIMLLWECRGDRDRVKHAGGAFGADCGMNGAATVSIPTNGCDVWYFNKPQHGFNYWGAQIMAHEVRNCISWYYNTYYKANGYPTLPDPYAGYCSKFRNNKECYAGWYSEMKKAIAGGSGSGGSGGSGSSNKNISFTIPSGARLTVD
jgi:hypothetical protein